LSQSTVCIGVCYTGILLLEFSLLVDQLILTRDKGSPLLFFQHSPAGLGTRRQGLVLEFGSLRRQWVASCVAAPAVCDDNGSQAVSQPHVLHSNSYENTSLLYNAEIRCVFPFQGISLCVITRAVSVCDSLSLCVCVCVCVCVSLAFNVWTGVVDRCRG
jgi:hypothetical protein